MKCTGNMRSSCKCYAALDYIIDHPGCSKNDIVRYMEDYCWRASQATSAICICLDSKWAVSNCSSGRLTASATFTATPEGKKIAEPARALKWLREFVTAVNSTGAETFEELDIQLALMGSHKFVERDFLKRIYHLLKGSSNEYDEARQYLEHRLSMPLISDIYAKAKEA